MPVLGRRHESVLLGGRDLRHEWVPGVCFVRIGLDVGVVHIPEIILLVPVLFVKRFLELGRSVVLPVLGRRHESVLLGGRDLLDCVAVAKGVGSFMRVVNVHPVIVVPCIFPCEWFLELHGGIVLPVFGRGFEAGWVCGVNSVSFIELDGRRRRSEEGQNYTSLGVFHLN